MKHLSLRLWQWMAVLGCGLFGSLPAQTTGDLAFTGFNADGNDGFAFVTLVDIPANTDIWFTDEEWDATTMAFASPTGEGDVVWSHTALVPAGTVIDVDGLSSTPVASLGTIVPGTNGGAGLSSSDEGIYVYLGTQRAPTVFLTAITNSTWGSGAGDLPAALTAGTNALELANAADVAAYTGPRLGQATLAGYLTPLYDLSNWIFDDGSGDQSLDGNAPDIPFDITPFATGTADLTPPVPTAATLTSQTSVLLTFNEPLDAVSAATAANYTLAPALAVNTATLLPGGDSVLLDVAPLADGVLYTLSILGVADTAGNAISPAVTFPLIFNGTLPALVITEIMYNNPSDDSLEFLEIYNHGTTPAELGGLSFAAGIDFTFPPHSLAPGTTVLVAVDTAAATSFFGVPFPYQFGGALGNGGETLLLVNSLGDTLDLVTYDDAAPWPLGPPSPDGDGPSMELLAPGLDNDNGANWVVSTTLVGQDGAGNNVWATPGSILTTVVSNLSLTTARQSVAEDSSAVMVIVALTGSPTDTVRARLALTTLGTATNGADFMSADTTLLLFAPGTTFDTLMVTIMDDADAENDEYFSLRLIDAENADITGTAAQIVYIRDNDRLAPAPSGAISLNLLTSYSNTPGAVENSAEIVAYAEASQLLFVANSVNNSLDLVDFSDPAAPAPVSSIDLSPLGEITSVAVYDTLVAVALANATDPVLDGSIAFFGTDGALLGQVTVGALPDMVTFTPDGSKALAAIEGQPSGDYLTDPEGAVAIVDLSGGLSQATVTLAGFGGYNGQQATLEANGVRISGPGATVAQDMEPEFITVSADGLTAWVTCQENNAVAVVDLVNDTIVAVLGMGSKDWSLPGAGLDATDQGAEIHLANYPFKGLYLPDAIASYAVGGTTYLITANEGDAREYDTYIDEGRLGDTDYVLDSAAFPNGDILKGAVGRFKVLVTEGDTDNDGDFDEIYGLGGRSFSIWDGGTGALVYDSGDMLELITSQDPVFGAIFNANDDGIVPKNRSDDKGPEPEGVTTGVINGRTYSFLALERIGGIMVHDVTDPANPVYVQYVNNRSTTSETGDFAPEGLIFIPAEASPTGQALLVVANEVSSTLSVYAIGGEITGEIAVADAFQNVGEDVGSITVNLTLTDGTPDSVVTVELALGSFATATEGADFNALAVTTVSFQPGDTAATATFAITDDSDAENDEYFSFRLQNPVNAFLGADNTHTVYILDDDRLAPTATEAITLDYLTSLPIGVAGDDAAEIVAYDATTRRLFVANSAANQVEVVDFSTPANPTLLAPIDISTYGGINSVATYGGIVATAIENDDKTLPGSVVFFDNAGTFLSQVTVGALPDMVTFTPDGSKVLTANEGEPNDDYSVDPEGSISIIDISGGVAGLTQANVSTADFAAFNSDSTQLRAAGVRLFGPGASVAQDLEPEYIAVSADGSTAFVTCQENNALARVDIATATVTGILPLGYKDHSLPGAGLDAEDRSDAIRIANYPIKGMYMPDAIAAFSANGTEYLITANEGDAREYDTYAEEVRLSSSSYPLDSAAFPDGDLLKANIGRLTVTLATGDTDGDGDYDEVHAFGGRSFTIWDGGTGALVYDSGDLLELITSQDPVYGAIFNATDDDIEPKNRSDNKGPEPEAVVVGEINGRQYAFLGLERIGGVMVFDVTDPAAVAFVDYANPRSTTDATGDLAPEGLVLIPNADSPDGKYYLVVANEVSSTLSVYEVGGATVDIDAPLAGPSLRVYPNPAQDRVTLDFAGLTGDKQVRLLTLDGRLLHRQAAPASLSSLILPVDQLAAGLYVVEVVSPAGRVSQRLMVR